MIYFKKSRIFCFFQTFWNLIIKNFMFSQIHTFNQKFLFLTQENMKIKAIRQEKRTKLINSQKIELKKQKRESQKDKNLNNNQSKQMLLRPPFMKQEDVQSHSSNGINHVEKQHSVKSSSKNKKKQNSLGMRKNNIVGMQYEANNMLNNQANYDSDNGSVHSVNSRKSKGKTKQSTLAIGKKDSSFININQNSAYSTKNQNNQHEYEIFKLDSDDDNKSVGSHASKNSRKNTVKQNSLGKNRNSRVNVQLNYNENNNKNHYKEEKQQTPPQTYYLEEESKVQTVKLNQNPSSNPVIKYNQALKTNPVIARNPQQKTRRTQQPKPKQALSPFQEITLKRQSNDQEPVYKLKEPQPKEKGYNTRDNFFGQKPTQNRLSQQNQVNPFMQQNPFLQKGKNQGETSNLVKNFKVDLQQSSTIQPQMISTKSVTKSRRNKIFDDSNNSIANSSNINTSRTNMEGSFERSRSKSKSKLGDLLKQSRDKKDQLAKSREKQIFTKPTAPQTTNQSNREGNFFSNNQYKQQNLGRINTRQSYESTNNLMGINQQNLVSLDSLPQQSRIGGGQKLGYHQVKIEQIKAKTVQNQIFDLGQSRESQLQLNLSMSNRQPQVSGIKGDSVHFNFEPQRKKGLNITSKQKPSGVESKSIESKKHLDRLMKKCQENQQFLAKSILSNNSELRTSQKQLLPNGPSPQINKKQETLNRPFEKPKEKTVQELEPNWYNIVKEEPAFQIKQVERKQIRRPSQKEIRLEENIQQTSQEYTPTPTAKGPQQIFGNPLSKPGLQQQFYQAPLSSQQANFFKGEINQNVARQQKNRILANIQKKSKAQKQTQSFQAPQHNQLRNKGQEPMNQRRKNLPRQINLPFQQSQPQYAKEQAHASSVSHELSLSQNGSQRSNSQKKNKKKQSSLNLMKKHKVQVRDQSPRAEQSFYEQQPQSPQYKNHQRQEPRVEKTIEPQTSIKMEDSRTKIESGRGKLQYKKPNLINFQESETEQEKVKSKTDINFYNYGETSQKSIRPPSSKPPLSRKSGASSSRSKSKAKQSTLNINMSKKDNKMKPGNADQKQRNKPQQKKKKTLLDIAQDKSYEGSAYGESDSQCSFNSRQSFGSVNSKGSRKSSGSKKESTLPITIKNKATTMGNFHPSLNKISSEVQIYDNYSENQSIYNQLPHQSTKQNSRQREQQRNNQQMQQRTIVSKDTYFIDEKGRLVKQDLIIQGSKVYGRNSNQSVEQMAMDRMRRSREYHRSRSKSRDGSKSRLSKKNSMTSFGADSQYADSRASNSNFFNGQQSNYNNYNEKQNLYIEQFVKPVQQPMLANNYKFQKPPSNNQRKIQRQFYENEEDQYHNSRAYQHQHQEDQYEEDQPVRNITLNELFGRNKKPPQSNGKTMYNQHNSNSNYYNTGNNEKSKYNNPNNGTYGNNSKFNGQESRQSNRKKSLSRTEKAFHNR